MTITFADVDRYEIERDGLRAYVRKAWPIIEPNTPYVHNWHIDAICDHLQAVSKGEITRLVIAVPPGTCKSILTSICWQTWEWTFMPGTKWLCASHDYKVSVRDTLRSRQLIDSSWYQYCFGHSFRRNPSQWQTLKFANESGGFRAAISVDSNVVGQHADRQVADDLIRPQDAHPDILDIPALDKVWEWWNSTMSSRLIPKISSARVMIMQRLHESDPVGRLLQEHPETTSLVLPMEFEPSRKSVTVLGFADPRTEEGELLWPLLHTAEMVAEKKKEMGERVYATQYQQRPAPAGGSLFKRAWLHNYWKELPARGMTFIQSWDTTFKGEEQNNYVVGQLWGYKQGTCYLIDQYRDKMGVTEQLEAITLFIAKYRRKYPASKILIEEAASGAFLVEMLKARGISGVVAEKIPNKSKALRAASVLPMWEAGNVLLPHPDIAPWLPEYVEELATFPMSKNDDQTDSSTQALTYLRNSSTITYINAMTRLSNPGGSDGIKAQRAHHRPETAIR